MKKKNLEAFKLFLDHFKQHRMQGKIFFFNLGISLIAFSTILGIYAGRALYDSIIKIFICG